MSSCQYIFANSVRSLKARVGGELYYHTRPCGYVLVSQEAVDEAVFFFFQAEDGIRDGTVTGVQTCALPICPGQRRRPGPARHAGSTSVNVVVPGCERATRRPRMRPASSEAIARPRPAPWASSDRKSVV